MKNKQTFLIIFMFSWISVFAEGYRLNFTASGAGSEINQVEVQNLATGTIITLDGGDILQLGARSVSDINAVSDSEISGLKIFSDISSQSLKAVFNIESSGSTNFKVLDVSGKVVLHETYGLFTGTHELALKGLSQGVYFISISTNSYNQISKFSSNAVGSGNPSIQLLNSKVNSVNKIKKKSKSSIVILEDYWEGDKILLKATSGNHKRIVVVQPNNDSIVDFKFIECVDYDGNHYAVVQIGNQYWMAESLKTTKYNNGDLIGTTSTPLQDISSETNPKYQWAFDGEETNATGYGRLYTWHVQADTRGVSPQGWLVPTITQWTTLHTYLGGSSVTGIKLKDIGTTNWTSPNAGTNETGFSALGGGVRYYGTPQTFQQFGTGVWFLESTGNTSNPANQRPRKIFYNLDKIDNYNVPKYQGCYIRCVREVVE